MSDSVSNDIFEGFTEMDVVEAQKGYEMFMENEGYSINLISDSHDDVSLINLTCNQDNNGDDEPTIEWIECFSWVNVDTFIGNLGPVNILDAEKKEIVFLTIFQSWPV